MRKLAAIFVFLGLLCSQAHATCSAGVLPNNLTNGTLADATQVMANYNAIISSVDATCAGSGANADITSLSGLTTALTAAQGGTNTWVASTASGGTANAQTVTTSLPTTSFTLTKGYSVTFLPGFQNSGATTLAVNGTTATAVCMRSNGGGVCNALTGNELNTGIWVTVTYDGTSFEIVSNQFVGGWGMTFGQVGSGNIIAQSTSAPARSCEQPIFATLSVTVSGNNLTVTLLNQSGVTPTAANPVLICFHNNSGGQTWVAVTAATTFTVNSGSSFGSTSAVLNRFWVMAFNNAGTVNIGVYNASSNQLGLASGPSIAAIQEIPNDIGTTACNACTNATSNQVYYSTTALSNVTGRIVGYFEATETTAGTWATAPSLVTMFTPDMKKPGDIVQIRMLSSATNPVTITTPLYSAANGVMLSGACEGSSTSAGAVIACSIKAGASTISSTYQMLQPTASGSTTITVSPLLYFPQTAASTAYTTNIGNTTTNSFINLLFEEIQGALEPANDNGEPQRLAG